MQPVLNTVELIVDTILHAGNNSTSTEQQINHYWRPIQLLKSTMHRGTMHQVTKLTICTQRGTEQYLHLAMISFNIGTQRLVLKKN
jgi:hypothetical protein